MSLESDPVVLSVDFGQEGLAMTVQYPQDERQMLDRMHTFQVGFEHPNFGEQVQEVERLLRELAQEVNYGYYKQPKAVVDDD